MSTKLLGLLSSLQLFRCPFQTGLLLLQENKSHLVRGTIQLQIQECLKLSHCHIYLHFLLYERQSRCCWGSVHAGLCYWKNRGWVAWWLPGYQAVWEACESGEMSDTAGGTFCHRWFWYLQVVAAAQGTNVTLGQYTDQFLLLQLCVILYNLPWNDDDKSIIY